MTKQEIQNKLYAIYAQPCTSALEKEAEELEVQLRLLAQSEQEPPEQEQ